MPLPGHREDTLDNTSAARGERSDEHAATLVSPSLHPVSPTPSAFPPPPPLDDDKTSLHTHRTENGKIAGARSNILRQNSTRGSGEKSLSSSTQRPGPGSVCWDRRRRQASWSSSSSLSSSGGLWLPHPTHVLRLPGRRAPLWRTSRSELTHSTHPHAQAQLLTLDYRSGCLLGCLCLYVSCTDLLQSPVRSRKYILSVMSSCVATTTSSQNWHPSSKKAHQSAAVADIDEMRCV